MNCTCPACGRSTSIELSLVDFFARCERCGVLLRPREEGEGARITAKVVPVGKVREAPANANGALAAMLCRPVVVRVPAKGIVVALPKRKPAGSGAALRRAALRHHHRMLGIVVVMVVVIVAGAMVLKAREMLRPRAAVAQEIPVARHE